MNHEQKSALLTGFKLMVASVLAFYIFMNDSWAYGYWTVVTVAAVTRPGLTNTYGKIITRIIGTLIGCAFAFVILSLAPQSPIIMILLFFICIVLSSYSALQKSVYNYGGIVIGLTLTIALSTALMIGHSALIIKYRMFDILLGIFCVAFVNFILRLFFPKKESVWVQLKNQFVDAHSKIIQWSENKSLLKTSLCIALAACLTYLPWLYWRYPGGFWATISCFFIMEESLVSAQEKSWLRFSSHVVAAIVGGLSALVIGIHAEWLVVPLALSFFAFGYVMVWSKTFSFSGNTMGIALAIMLLAGVGTNSSLEVVAARFFNVIGGIAIGLFITYLMRRKEVAPT